MIEETGILMGESVVILLPYVGGEDEVEGRDVLPPGELVADLQPFCVLCRHGVDDADERLVGGKEPVAPGEDIAFQPAFAHMLGEIRVHDPSVMRELVVVGIDLRVEVAVRRFEGAVEAVAHALVRPEDAEVFAVLVEPEYVADITAELEHILRAHRAGRGHVHRVFFEVGQAQIAQQFAAVRVRVGADAVISFRSEGAQLGDQAIVFIEQLFGFIAQEPVFEQLKVFGLFHRDGDLMGAEGVFDLHPVHDLRARPAFGGAQYDHRPEGALFQFAFARLFLNVLDLLDALVEGFRHLFMHGHGIVALHEVGLPAAAVEEALHLVVRDAREDGGVIDLVAVQVQDGEDCAVACGVEEFVGMPCRRERARLRFAVADGNGRDEVGVVEHRAERMGDGVTELAALIDGAGGLGRHMAGDAAGERELFAQFLHPFVVLSDVGVYFAVRPFEVRVRHEEVSAVSGAGKQDHVEVVFFDRPVEVHINEVLPGHRSPMSDDLFLDLVTGQRLSQEGVVQHIQLCSREVVRRAPIGVHLFEIVVRQGHLLGASLCFAHFSATPFIIFSLYIINEISEFSRVDRKIFVRFLFCLFFTDWNR